MSVLDLRQNCDICVEYYDDTARIPRMLKCGHTKCHICIKALLVSSSTPTCPECRTSINVETLFDIPVNFNVIKLNAEIENQSKISCDESRPICLKKIDSCEKHEEEILDKWCKSCQEWVCINCISSEHQDPDKKCLILPKKKVLEEMSEKLSDINNEFSVKLLKSYKKLIEKNEVLDNCLTKLNSKKQWQLDELDLTNKSIEEIQEGKSKFPSAKTILKKTEVSMSKYSLELFTVKSICEYTKIEEKMKDSFKTAQQIMDDADSQFNILDSLLTKYEGVSKTDLSKIGNQEDEITNTEIVDSSYLNVTHFAIKQMEKKNFYSKVLINEKKREIHHLSSELPPKHSINAKFNDNYVNMVNTPEGFIYFQIENYIPEKITFTFPCDRTEEVCNFFKLLIGEVNGKTYKGSKITLNQAGIAGGDYEGKQGRESNPVVTLEKKKSKKTNSSFGQIRQISSDHHRYSRFCIISGGEEWNSCPLLATIRSGMEIVKKVRQHIKRNLPGDVIVSDCGIINEMEY